MKYVFAFFFISMITYSLKGQQSTNTEINNLEHSKNYLGVPIGELGSVLVYGSGEQSLLLIVGMGFNQSLFFDFMMRNEDKYKMYVFTPAGYGGTIAPVMPADSSELSERIWSNAFEDGVLEYLDENGLDKNISILGFFSQGIQHAVHIVKKRPEMFSKLILSSGELYRDYGIPLPIEQRYGIARQQLNSSFKTVKPEVWYKGMFKPSLYSINKVKAQRFWEMTAQPTLPTLIRYLGEFMGDDVSLILKDLKTPTLAVLPGFDEEYKKKKSYNRYGYWFNGIWQNFVKDNKLKHIQIEEIKNSRLMTFIDQPTLFDNAVNTFLAD
jgi:pimeloyl-ACP methyl ester carboxylesterase